MRLKHVLLGTMVVAAAAGLYIGKTMMTAAIPAPEITFDVPQSLQAPVEPSAALLPVRLTSDVMNESAIELPQLPSLQLAAPDELTKVIQALVIPPWEATVETGDTLGALLSRAGLKAPLRAEVALAVAAEYDLRRLRPGHRLSIAFRPGGTPSMIYLAVDDGVRIEITLDATIASRTVTPIPVSVERAGRLLVNGSIYASLDQAGVPPRFAVDLAQILGDTVDFRRDLQGGESLNILWAQDTLEDGSPIEQPQMSYAALDLPEDRFEIVWSDEDRGRAIVYLNGEILRTVSPPVKGARLSSVFGQRKHPIYGNVRMHTGVDYAAKKGTPITATAPGRVSFIGRRGGYGRVVEISHGSDTMTRYAHLSAVPDGLATGNRVLAGEVIGQVGETGTATAPNLHYEVRVGGRPIDPLGEERLASVENLDIADAAAILEETRTRFSATLGDKT